MDRPRVWPADQLRQWSNDEVGVTSRAVWANLLPGKLRDLSGLFILCVIVPTIIASLYYGLIASDIYISESRFVVRSADKPMGTGLGFLLKSTGFSTGGDEISAAQDFVLSRDALRELNRNGDFQRAYEGNVASIFDRFNPFGSDGSFEELYRYYQGKVKVEQEGSAAITTLSVRAFTPQEAKAINEKLLEMAEATVNRLNARGRADLIRFAQVEVDDARNKARAAALALSAYRNSAGVVDPERQAAVQLQMVSKIQDELIATKIQLRQLRTVAPRNPQIEVLAARADELKGEIDEQLHKVAGDKGSLSSSVAQFQRLSLENQFADKQLASAMASLEDARNEARRKQAYVERIVQPNRPDKALEPKRVKGIFAVFILGLVAWALISMLRAGLHEHQD